MFSSGSNIRASPGPEDGGFVFWIVPGMVGSEARRDTESGCDCDDWTFGWGSMDLSVFSVRVDMKYGVSQDYIHRIYAHSEPYRGME